MDKGYSINKVNNKIVTDFIIEKKKYRVVGEYIKSKSNFKPNEKKQEKEYMATLYFLDETEKEKDYKDSQVNRNEDAESEDCPPDGLPIAIARKLLQGDNG